MRKELLERVKAEITNSLTAYLNAEQITLYIAANDNIPSDVLAVSLQGIEHKPLFCEKLVTEIRVLFAVTGKSAACDALIDALYACLHPYQLTLQELNVLLMSMYVDSSLALPRRRVQKKAVMRYIFEEAPETIPEYEYKNSAPPTKEERQFCDS